MSAHFAAKPSRRLDMVADLRHRGGFPRVRRRCSGPDGPRRQHHLRSAEPARVAQRRRRPARDADLRAGRGHGRRADRGLERDQRQLHGADAAHPPRRHDPRQGGQRHRPGRGRHRRAAAHQHPLSRHGRGPEAPRRRQCLHPDQARAGAALRRVRARRSPAGPALVPRPRPHLSSTTRSARASRAC